MKVKKIQADAFKTSDGKVFLNESEAEYHERKLKAKELANSIYYFGIDEDGLAQALIEHDLV